MAIDRKPTLAEFAARRRPPDKGRRCLLCNNAQQKDIVAERDKGVSDAVVAQWLREVHHLAVSEKDVTAHFARGHESAGGNVKR